MKNIKMHDTKNKRWRYAHSKKKKKGESYSRASATIN